MQDQKTTKPQPLTSDAANRKSKPSKIIPTNRLSFKKQLDILRAFAVASEAASGGPVTNEDAGKIVDMAALTVVVTNAFFVDVGLLKRAEPGFAVSQEVLNFQKAWEWNQATAGPKLGPVLSKSWFAQALLPRLRFRPLPEAEALQVLAEASGATKEYEPQLRTLIDYLETAGIISWDNGQVRQGAPAEKPSDPPPLNPADENTPPPFTPMAEELGKYVLMLDAADPKRRVTVESPIKVSPQELKRIQDWLGFQLIVTDDPLQ